MNVIEHMKIIDEYKKLSSVLRKFTEDGSIKDTATILSVIRCADIIENLAINSENELKNIDFSWKPVCSMIGKINIDNC